MKSLTTLIKLQKTYVDEQREQLGKLQAYVEAVRERITMLEIEKAREQAAVEQEFAARQTYGAFLKGAIKRGQELDRELNAALQAVEIARDKLGELFEEQKRYEIAEDNRLKTEAFEDNRREKIALDEVGSVSFQRGKEK